MYTSCKILNMAILVLLILSVDIINLIAAKFPSPERQGMHLKKRFFKENFSLQIARQ